MIFYLLVIINLFLSTFFQFHIANVMSENETDTVFFLIGLSSVIISMSTSGLSGYLITNFSKESECNKLCDVFSEKFSFFVIFFGLISFLCAIGGLSWREYFSESESSVSLFTWMFLFCFFSSLNILGQSFSYSLNKAKEYEMISLISFGFSFLLLFDYSVNNVIAFFSIRLILTVSVFLALYTRSLKFFHISINSAKSVFNDIRVMIFGGGIYKSEPLIDKIIISSVTGGITALHLITQIYNAVLGIWFKVYTSNEIVVLSRLQSSSDRTGFTARLKRSYTMVSIISIVCLLITFWTPVLDIILGFEIFSSLKNYKTIIMILLIYFITSLFGQIISNIFYVKGDYKTPVIVSTISFMVFIPIKIHFVEMYGLLSVALLMVVYHIVNTTILYFINRARNEKNISSH